MCAALLAAAGVGSDGAGPAGAVGPARLVMGEDFGPRPGLGANAGWPPPLGELPPPPSLWGGPVVLLCVLCVLGRLPGTSAGPCGPVFAI